MTKNDYFITITWDKALNREAWCIKRGKYHDDNRAKAKERKRLESKSNTACRMPKSGGGFIYE